MVMAMVKPLVACTRQNLLRAGHQVGEDAGEWDGRAWDGMASRNAGERRTRNWMLADSSVRDESMAGDDGDYDERRRRRRARVSGWWEGRTSSLDWLEGGGDAILRGVRGG